MGYVDGNRLYLQPPVLLAAEKMAGLFPGIPVYSADKTVPLKNGNEASGADSAFFWIFPSQQCLSSNWSGCIYLASYLVDRLELYIKLFFLKGWLHFPGNKPFCGQHIAHGFVIKHITLLLAAAGIGHGLVCPVQHHGWL